MKLEELVLSIEQAKHLQELGLDMSDACLEWVRFPNGDFDVVPRWLLNEKFKERTPTYTLQEVLDKLPPRIREEKDYFPYVDFYDELVRYCSAVTLSEEGTYLDIKDKSDSLLESAYNILCWVIENGYLEDKK